MAAPTALAQSPCSTWITWETPGQLVGDQEGAAADGDQRHVARFGLHAVDRLFGQARGLGEHLPAGGGVEMGDLALVAELQHATRDGDVRGRELLAAEGDAVLQQPVTHRHRADLDRVEGNVAAAAQADRQQVGHAEQRAHAADLDHRIGLAREAVLELAHVRGGAADIDHHGVAEA